MFDCSSSEHFMSLSQLSTAAHAALKPLGCHNFQVSLFWSWSGPLWFWSWARPIPPGSFLTRGWDTSICLVLVLAEACLHRPFLSGARPNPLPLAMVSGASEAPRASCARYPAVLVLPGPQLDPLPFSHPLSPPLLRCSSPSLPWAAPRYGGLCRLRR